MRAESRVGGGGVNTRMTLAVDMREGEERGSENRGAEGERKQRRSYE
jgi:hypothetical protein